MARHRPIGVTVLAVLGALAALVSAYNALQYLGIIPLVLGPLSFRGQDWPGAVLWALHPSLVWVTMVLWWVNQQGWLFVVRISALNLVLAGLSLLGASTFRARLPAILLDGAVPLCSPMPGVQGAFGVGSTVTYYR
jgi:hypothetical protein